MKRLLNTLMAITVSFTIFAQAPNAFNYQGIARDLTGNPILNRNIGIRVSILQGTITGTEAYKELHLISTSNTGLFNIQIGNGTPANGTIGSISWGEGPFFLKIEMDENGGSNYKLIGTNQLLSVPYALFAEKSGNSTLWSKNGNNVYYDNGNVGIGNNNPVSKLQVSNGDVMIPEGNLYFGKFLKIGDYEANSHTSQFELNQNSIIYGRYLNGLYGNMVLQANSTEYASSINFVTGSSLSRDNNLPALRMVIMGNGNIGINKTNPTSRLDVKGVVNVNNNNITNVATPVNAGDAVNKAYVDALLEKVLQLEADLGVKDVDGNSYKAVKIGNQVWMAENLKTTKYSDGTSIPYVTDGTTWKSLTTGAYCYFMNSTSNGAIYGGLYNFFAAIDNRKICPKGWHVPSDAEWSILREFLGGEEIAGAKIKEEGTAHWKSPNTADNSSKFTALPGSWRGLDGGFFYTIGDCAAWWTSTAYNDTYVYPGTYAWVYSVWGGPKLNRTIDPYSPRYAGQSIRCIKD